jgi:periplasmic copper chaperone A
MRKFCLLAAGICAICLGTVQALAAPPAATPPASSDMTQIKLGSLLIEAPWARASPPNAKIGGGFVTITNKGNEPDRLTGGTAAFADRVEIHQSQMEGSVMRMRPLADGVEIQPGQTVAFKPGSYHLMFVNLKAPLKKGSRVKVTLAFEKAGAVDVEFPVVATGAGAPQMPTR